MESGSEADTNQEAKASGGDADGEEAVYEARRCVFRGRLCRCVCVYRVMAGVETHVWGGCARGSVSKGRALGEAGMFG